MIEAGAISSAEQQHLAERNRQTLSQLAALQARYQQSSDPALRFVVLLQAALTCGHAHVADRRGRAPDQAEVWGWQRKLTGRTWVGLGTRIGWVTGNEVFLEPEDSYEVAQSLANSEQLAVSEQTLRHRLRERGLLVSTDVGRQMLTGAPNVGGMPETKCSISK